MLVVGPASVLANWAREFGTWGAFRAALYHGEGERRAAALESIKQGRAEVLITSGATYRRARARSMHGARLLRAFGRWC